MLNAPLGWLGILLGMLAGAAFGFRVAWCNRFGQGREELPSQPDAEIVSLAEFPALLGLE